MNINLRSYTATDDDSPASRSNLELCSEGDCLPSDRPLAESSGAAFFSEQPYTSVAWDSDNGDIMHGLIHPPS